MTAAEVSALRVLAVLGDELDAPTWATKLGLSVIIVRRLGRLLRLRFPHSWPIARIGRKGQNGGPRPGRPSLVTRYIRQRRGARLRWLSRQCVVPPVVVVAVVDGLKQIEEPRKERCHG